MDPRTAPRGRCGELEGPVQAAGHDRQRVVLQHDHGGRAGQPSPVSITWTRSFSAAPLLEAELGLAVAVAVAVGPAVWPDPDGGAAFVDEWPVTCQ